jgi:hypothetical protein
MKNEGHSREQSELSLTRKTSNVTGLGGITGQEVCTNTDTRQ